MAKDYYPATPVHLNGNLLCAIDVATTGANPRINDILEVAIIPLAPDYTMSQTLQIFGMKIKPQRVEGWDEQLTVASKKLITESMRSGVEPSLAGDLFIDWFKSLGLPERKKIVPVSHNFDAIDKPFLREWLTPSTYEYYFDFKTRDLMRAVTFVNDVHDMRSLKIPFPKYGLESICNRLGVKFDKLDSKTDAILHAECYRRLMNMASFLI